MGATMVCKVTSAVLLALAFGVPAASAAGEARWAGKPLAEVLREVAASGLAVVYSSALVTPDMVVETEPEATFPLDLLREVLAPFGLALREGPGGQLVVVRRTDAGAAPATGSIRGTLETDAGATLAGVTARIEPLGAEAHADRQGRFAFANIPPGVYAVEAGSPAFVPVRVERVRVYAGKVTAVHIELTPATGFIEHIRVTPSHFRLFAQEPAVRQFLSRDEVALMPHLADDAFRAVKALPGVSGGEFSAGFSVRGGSHDEVLILLDGLELFEPFHLKDFQNLFSAVDAETLGGVEFLTGGFPVEYGDRLSGVLDMAIATPTEAQATSVGIGTFNAQVLSTGQWNEGAGHWLASLRGWLDG
jgi:hypothetical protein